MNNQGNYGVDCIPKFFKVYLPDESGDDLELPISYNKWLPNPLPKSVTVRSIYGKVWKMVLRKCIGDDTEKFVLVDGWKRIVKAEILEGGEFLEFEFDGFSRFNFCIYGYATCKRLRSSEQPIEIEDQYDGEVDKSSDAPIVLDDDDADDVNHDQDYGDKSVDNIIELDDDEDNDINGVEDHVEEDIEVLDDDDDDNTNDVHVEEDTISLTDDDENESVDAAEDDNDEDDEDEDVDAAADERQHLDNRNNPYFLATTNSKKRNRLVIPDQVRNDYALNFKESIFLVDPLSETFGKVEKKIYIHISGRMFVNGFSTIMRRNQVKTRDKLVCEIKKRGRNNLVHTIKIHVVRG